MMTTALRKLTYTTHLVSSVGWMGAVFVFLALSTIGLTSENETAVRGVYLVMLPAGWVVLVPLAHASVLSGVTLSLGTAWGLWRHYWVVSKLAITVAATIILMVYLRTFAEMAGVAADATRDLASVRNPSPLVHSVLALVALVAATLLGIYKPFGPTPYATRPERGFYAGAAVLIVALLVFLAMWHLSGAGGFHH